MDKTIVDFEPPQPAGALYRARRVAAKDGSGRQINRSFSGVALAAVAVVAIILVSMSTFIVNPTEQALILRFGQPVRDLIDAPGLYFKWPFVDTVVYIDSAFSRSTTSARKCSCPTISASRSTPSCVTASLDPLLFYQSVSDTRGADARNSAAC